MTKTINRNQGQRNHRMTSCLGFITCAVGAMSLAVGAPPDESPAAKYRRLFEQVEEDFFAMGAGDCASCHTTGQYKKPELKVGNEHNVWLNEQKGTHYVAYKSLDSTRGREIARILFKDASAATTQSECLACHSHFVDPAHQSDAFMPADGVDCEACHGRGEKWQGPHHTPAWARRSVEERRKMGWWDLLDPIHRTERCLQCHLGTQEQSVTHRMLAAGHPELDFELVTDSDDVPKHWRSERGLLSGETEPWVEARFWAVGQAVTFGEWMYKLSVWASSNEPADYTLFECYSCHHNLDPAPNWRQTLDPIGRRGEPAWNTSSWTACRPLVSLLPPAKAAEFESLISVVAKSLTLHEPDRKALQKAADELVVLANALAEAAQTKRFARFDVVQLIRQICNDADDSERLDYRSAQQAYEALNILYGRVLRKATPSGETLKANDLLDGLQKYLYDKDGKDKPAGFDAKGFSERLREFGAQPPIGGNQSLD